MSPISALFLSLLLVASCNEVEPSRTDSTSGDQKPDMAGDEQLAVASQAACWGTWNVELRTFIECPFVKLPGGLLEAYFNGGTKSVQTAVMSSDPNIADPRPTGYFNSTYSFRVGALKPGIPGYPASPAGMRDIESYQGCAGGTNATCPKYVGPYDTDIIDFYSSENHAKAPASGLVATITKPNIHFVASGGDPLVPFAPTLDADINVRIVQPSQGANATVTVTGSHDAYPGYCLKINGAVIYCYSSNALGYIPVDLAIPWKARTVNLTKTIAAPACQNTQPDNIFVDIAQPSKNPGTVKGVFKIDCPGKCSEYIRSGTYVRYDAKANTGYKFNSWSGHVCNGSNNRTDCQFTATGSTVRLQANFTPVTSPTPSPTACAVSPPTQTASANSTQTLNWSLRNCLGTKTIILKAQPTCFSQVSVNPASLVTGVLGTGASFSYSNGIYTWRNSVIQASSATFSARTTNTGSNCNLTLEVN